MFKRKQDVDKHVSSILSRKRDEKEKQAQGFQIARLYVDIKEYAIAKRYLSGFLNIRENVPQAHQLMGEINEALKLKQDAIESYKRALNLGSFGSSNRHLVVKIAELYGEIGTDLERIKYWCEQCEKVCPKSDVIFKLKEQIAEAGNGQNGENSKEIEDLVASELVNNPTNVKLRIKLLNMYLDSERYEEAYNTAVSTDLTTAFVSSLPWFECLQTIFHLYHEKFPECKTEPSFHQMYLHVLRNLTYLGMGCREVEECKQNLERFDQQLKEAVSLPNQDEAWLAIVKEMKGQMFFLAGLLLLKRAQTGAVTWQEVNQLSGACFLASRNIDPLDAQAPWFVRASNDYRKFYNWWHLQSYDRISQVGHMLLQLSQKDIADWSKGVRQQTMTAAGHQRVFRALYAPRDMKAEGEKSFFYQASEMVDSSDPREPLTVRHMIDIDRVASQVHLGSLSHLVWLCLQRYTYEASAQPNYHFTLLENIQYSVKNMDSGVAESLCQLDILVFLLASVRCAANAVAEKLTFCKEHSGRPSLLPVCLGKPLCTHDQEEWWTAAYKFCTNTVKDEFSRLRRVLIRGIETVRLIGSHGVSVSMMAHIARSLDGKVRSLRESEYGCRCPVSELNALESRAAFYWEKTKQALQRLQRNHHSPVPKNRLFKEQGDMDVPVRLVDKYLAEAVFALSLVAMKSGQFEEALEGFETHRSPWAKFHCAQIYKLLAERETDDDDTEESSGKKQALMLKARDCLYDVMDRLNGDRGHELNVLVSKEMDDLEMKIHGFEFTDERNTSVNSSFHTPNRSPPSARASASSNGFVHSTPRQPVFSASHTSNGVGQSESATEANYTIRDHNISSTSDTNGRPRPSPERLDSQIRSLCYSQSSLFKMVLDRNEELIMINGKMMEELRDNNNQLKSVLAENKGLMEELKTFLVDNREMMKQIKAELSTIKPNLVPPAAPPIPPAPPLFMPHMPTPPPPRGPYPGFPSQAPVVPPAYGGYMINSPVPPQAAQVRPNYRPSGLPGSRASNVGKYRPQSEEEEEEEEDLSNVDEASAIYREFFDPDQSYTQYFTPESQMLQDWSLTRSGMEGQPPLPLPPLQPRMSMPAPGYFASALRGQSLQYAQTSQTPGQVKPAAPGPGFFSSPATAGVGTAAATSPAGLRMPAPGTPLLATAAAPVVSDSVQSPTLTAALTGQRPISGGVQILFQAKAVMEPKKSKGDITIIVDTNTNRATILMIGEARDILFHHDLSGVKLEVCFVPANVIWTGLKVGSTEKEKITVSLEPVALATQLKEAIQKAAAMIQPKTTPPAQVPSTTPKIFSSISATSTPIAATTTTATTPASKDAGKFTFGGLTFSSTPTIAPAAETERAKTEAHKSPATTKSDDSKPFASISLTPASTAAKSEIKFAPVSTSETMKSVTDKTQSPFTSQKSPGVVPKSPGIVVRSPGGGDEEHVEEYEPNVDFKPVITLPELVEKKTGEENETAVFVDRCRLFRFDAESKQWKERGVGELKILRSNDQVKFRIIMRREQILKLCANHFLNAEMRLTPMAASDRAWCYSAMDFSEEEMKLEQLAVKFKNAEKANAFKEVFNDCCRQLREMAEAKGPTGAQGEDLTVAAADSTTGKGAAEASKDAVKFPAAGSGMVFGGVFGGASASDTRPLSDLFKPKAGSWECGGCLVRNSEDVVKCPACGTMKPGSKPAATPAAAPAPSQSLSEMFKPKAGSWECDGCLVRNNQDVIKCPACGTLKPGAKPEDVATDKSSSGFSFIKAAAAQPGTGFKFGATTTTSTMPSTGGFTFQSPAAPTATTTASGGFRFGTAATTTAGTSPPSTGFIFKSQAATFGTGTTTTASSLATGFIFKSQVATTTVTPATTSGGKPATGFTFQPTATATTPITAAAASTTVAPASTTTAGSSGFTFKPTAATSGFTMATSASAVTTAASVTSSSVTSTSTSGSTGFTFGGGPKPTGFSFATPSKDGTAGQSPAPSGGLLAKLLTSEDSAAEMKVLGAAAASKPSGGFSFTMPSKSTSVFGGNTSTSTTSTAGSTGFNFSFTKSPPKTQQGAAVVPSSPEVDEHGMYVNKEGDDSHIHFEPVVNLPERIEVKTGEEDEDILFENRGKMYRYVSGEWKEKGVGVVKILQHRQTKKTRVLMRRDQVLKICCNHKIDPALNLQPMPRSEGRAWVWYALDFSEDEGKMEQLALRFRTAEIAGEFKKVFDHCRDTATPSPAKGEAVTHQGQGDVASAPKKDGIPAKKELFKADSTTSEDDDVIFVGEDKPTPEQIARARKWLLPDPFYMYENKPPCPGCIGCGDGELPAVVSPPSRSKSKEMAKEKPKTKESASSDLPVFGGAANLPDFASLTSDAPSDKKDSGDGGFVFGSGATVDFHQLAASGQNTDYAWKKADSSAPFHFAGAGQKLFGAGANVSGDGEEGDDSAVAPSDDVHFEPVIPLPDLVEVKTGEEDWKPLFCHRAKLYKFDKQVSQWKERGIGDIKIMSHNTKIMFRVLQRREQVLKVACNHLITPDMEVKPLATSETSWCWIANDFTDTEPSVEQFAVKFKTKEIALEFKKVFENCQEILRHAEHAGQGSQQQEREQESPQQQQQQQAEAACKNDEDEEEEEEEDEDDEEESVVFEKRTTLSSFENGAWKKLGMGTLKVVYNEDVNGNQISFTTDSGEQKCNHIICREHTIALNQRSCEWRPIDYATDEPIRQHFSATFSSAPAAEEFIKVFNEGQRLAVDSELSENIPSEIDVPEIFSGGEPGH